MLKNQPVRLRSVFRLRLEAYTLSNQLTTPLDILTEQAFFQPHMSKCSYPSEPIQPHPVP